jgi:hypothetical protein
MTFLYKDGVNAPSMQPYDEVQTVSMGGTVTGGTFTLTFNGQTTSALAWNVTATVAQTALNALSSVAPGSVTVTGGALPGTPLTITFTGGRIASRDIFNTTANGASLTGTAPTVSVVVTRVGGTKKPNPAS